MEQQKNSYTGRFGEEKKRSAADPARRVRSDQPRMPSGFSGAGQAPRPKPAPEAQAAAPEKKKKKEKKAQIRREKPVRREGAGKFSLKKALVALLALVLAGLVLLMIFGDRGTYHQMPTITREEAQPSFEPDKTPLPGVQEAI